MNPLQPKSPCGITMTGKVRENNEDSFVFTRDENWTNQLAVISDGIGGSHGGEIASRLCCQYFLDIWERKKAMNISGPRKMITFMQEALAETNSRIYKKNSDLGLLDAPMGATVVAAAFMPRDIIIIHAGDSRFYDFRSNGKLLTLTGDHTFLQKNKALLPNAKNVDFINSELCNLLTKSVGSSSVICDDDPKAPLITAIKRRNDSRYILCSDGITHMLNNDQITTILKNNPDNRRALNKLVAASFSAGATDNLSIIII